MSSEDEREDAKNGKSSLLKDIGLVVLGVFLTGAVDRWFVLPAQVDATKTMEQEAIVKELSKRFDFVDLDSEYKDAIEAVYKKYNAAKQRADDAESLNKELGKENATLTSEANVSSAVYRAKEYAKEEKYTLAIDTLSGVSSPTAEVRALLARYEELAAAQLWNTARAMAADGYFEDATKAIDNYDYELPDGYDIDELRDEIERYKPKPISELIVVDSQDWSVNEGKPVDHFGNEHYSEYTSTIYNDWGYSSKSCYIEYRSYERYKKLTGTISPYEEIDHATVRIILDDRTVKTYELGKKTDPIPFECDISKVDYIRFEVDLQWSSGVIISDVVVS